LEKIGEILVANLHLKILGAYAVFSLSLCVLCSCARINQRRVLMCGDGEKKGRTRATTTREKQKKRLLSFL
jgi:hypothetical protein